MATLNTFNFAAEGVRGSPSKVRTVRSWNYEKFHVNPISSSKYKYLFPKLIDSDPLWNIEILEKKIYLYKHIRLYVFNLLVIAFYVSLKFPLFLVPHWALLKC